MTAKRSAQCVTLSVLAALSIALIGVSTSSGASTPTAVPSSSARAVGSAADAPKIPFKPLVERGKTGLQIMIPVVVPKSMIGLIADPDNYSCSGRVAGLPGIKVESSIWVSARKAVPFALKSAGKNLPPAVKRQWSTFATQQDAAVLFCHAGWENNRAAKGKTFRGTFVIGGVQGVPAARTSFSFGICDWLQPSCRTMGYMPAR